MEINERDFFKNPFSRAEIVALLGEKPPAEMFNFRSPSFKALGLKRDSLGPEELIDWMLKEPRLIRRPVVRIGEKVYFSADRSVLEGLLSPPVAAS